MSPHLCWRHVVGAGSRSLPGRARASVRRRRGEPVTKTGARRRRHRRRAVLSRQTRSTRASGGSQKRGNAHRGDSRPGNGEGATVSRSRETGSAAATSAASGAFKSFPVGNRSGSLPTPREALLGPREDALPGRRSDRPRGEDRGAGRAREVAGRGERRPPAGPGRERGKDGRRTSTARDARAAPSRRADVTRTHRH